MDIVLYFFPKACSRVTMTALEKIGLDYRGEVINIFDGQSKSPEYLKVHPDGKVPALSVNGEVITENVSILLYLARAYPEAGLLPGADNPVAQAQAISDLIWCGGTLHPLVRQIRMPIRFTDGDPSGVREKGMESVTAVFERVGQRFESQPWWFGDQWSIVDVYFAWACGIAESGGFPIMEYPWIAEHRSRLEALQYYSRALAKEDAALEKYNIVMPPPMKPG
ncbi:MAG: glutathione S-transferase family protein [Pseudomonadota bacterium]